MVYLFIDSNHIKLLYLKKTILGQFETIFFEKKYEAQLLDKGRCVNTDLLASAIKEAFNSSSSHPISEKQVFLILPQESFYFLRTEVPSDIAPSAMSSFIYDKARAALSYDIDSCINDCFVQEEDAQKVVTFYAVDGETFETYQQVLSLIDLKIIAVLPDTLAYFKLFEKTLRREKKENIFYVYYEKTSLFGYIFDSFGLVEPQKWVSTLGIDKGIEEVLKEKIQELEEKKNKLNRIILSGPDSETIRQDTFTKSVGVWTNPIKRIISTFYKEYLKILIPNQQKQLPLLALDVCFGAFIFHEENKTFSLMKNGHKIAKHKEPLSLPKISLPPKEALLFAGSFVLSFIFFLIVSNLKVNLRFDIFKKSPPTAVKTTSLPTATPTPTPSIKREDVKIKVLNGSGTKGKATDVKDLLKTKGYLEILTDNADNFDYTQSELRVKKSKVEATSLIKNDLKDYVTSFKESVLEEKEAADVVIIIGKDFK